MSFVTASRTARETVSVIDYTDADGAVLIRNIVSRLSIDLADFEAEEGLQEFMSDFVGMLGLRSFRADSASLLPARAERQEFHVDHDFYVEEGEAAGSVYQKDFAIVMVLALEDDTPATLYKRWTANGHCVDGDSGVVTTNLMLQPGDALIHDAYHTCHAGPARSSVVLSIRFKIRQGAYTAARPPCLVFVEELGTAAISA